MRKARPTFISLAKELGIESAVGLYRIQKHWDSTMGNPIVEHCAPKSLTNGMLLIIVSSSVWLQEMQFQKTRLLEIFSDEGVTDIRFTLGRINRKPPVPPPPVGTIMQEDEAFIEELGGEVADPELREHIKEAVRQWVLRMSRDRKSAYPS